MKFSTSDKTVDDDDNDVYETIEFSDSSSAHLYTEPIREYGVLRKVNIKTSPRQQSLNKKKTGLKKSGGSRNLQKFAAMENVSVAEEPDEVELRVKPVKAANNRISTNPNCSLISVGKTTLNFAERNAN